MPIVIYLLVFAYVAYNVVSRAVIARNNGSKVWPILAVLAVAYIVLFVMRFVTGFHNETFWGASVIVIIASRLLYRAHSANW